jgi:ABC-type sugar transport system permease subunit
MKTGARELNAGRSNAMKQRALNLLYLAPLLLVFILLIAYPFLQTAIFSFYEEALDGSTKYVGFSNYLRVFKSTQFKQVFHNTWKWTFGATLLKVGSGLLVGLLLYQDFKLKPLVMLIVLLPWAIPYSVSHIIWKWAFDSMFGHLNSMFLRIGLIQAPLEWLANPNFSIWGIVIANSWTGMPFCAFSILSGLYSIPTELYEACAVDGASPIKVFRYITLPLLRPVLTLVTALAGIWTFTNFGAIWLMTKGGPLNSSTVLIVDIYRNAFEFQRPGYASALSVLSALFLGLLSIFYVHSQRDNLD